MQGKILLDTITIFDSIRDDLARVELKLHEKPKLEFQVLSIAIEHLLSSGGKRVRPALTLLVSRFYSTEAAPELIALAAATEMVHTASLVHDDLIDGSLLRRGIPTLNASWTRGATILTGDYLFARAADLAAQTGSLRVMRTFAETLMVICTGELKQQFSDLQTRVRRDDYYARIYAKTASLFALATEAAGVLENAPDDQVAALREYGHNLGMAFQVVDDVLDFIGDETHLGKPVGSDLRQGIITLPTLCYLEQHPNDELVFRFLREGHGSEEDIRRAVQVIRESGAIDTALEEARNFARRSLLALTRLPNGSPCQAMQELADFVVQRRT
jgi:geranylgeranyl pyrophosphate synthase